MKTTLLAVVFSLGVLSTGCGAHSHGKRSSVAPAVMVGAVVVGVLLLGAVASSTDCGNPTSTCAMGPDVLPEGVR